MKFHSIQYIRAVAALLVVFYHETVYLDRIAGYPLLLNIFGGNPGLFGVIAFFIVSGYLMADIAPKYLPNTFLLHRIIRIYPTYWFCVPVAALFYIALWYLTKPNADFVPNIGSMLWAGGVSPNLLRLTLAPIAFPDFPLGIEWTLLYETTFYVTIFAISRLGQLKYLTLFALLWFVAIGIAVLAFPQSQVGYTQPTLLTLPFFTINSAFILGLLGPMLQPKIEPFSAIAAGVLMIVLVGIFPTRWAMIQICLGIFAMVMGLIALERKGMLGENAALLRLGGWSYALYLVHVPVIVGTFKLMSDSGPWLKLATAMGLALLVSALIGTLDVVCYQKLKRRLDQTSVKVHVAIVTVFLAVFFSAGALGFFLR